MIVLASLMEYCGAKCCYVESCDVKSCGKGSLVDYMLASVQWDVTR